MTENLMALAHRIGPTMNEWEQKQHKAHEPWTPQLQAAPVPGWQGGCKVVLWGEWVAMCRSRGTSAEELVAPLLVC